MSDPAIENHPGGLPRSRAVRAAKTFVWVLGVTVLIWVYADLEKTETQEFRAKMVLRVGAGGDLAMLGGNDLSRQEVDVIFRASGSRGGLDRVGKELSERPGALTADVSAYGRGKHQVPVVELLRGVEAIRDAGLTVLSASPALVNVDLDAALRVPDVEVRARLPVVGGVEATVRPPRIALTVAKSQWEKLTRGGAKPVLETELLNLPAAAADPNRPIQAAVVPFISGVLVEPNQPFVEVTLRVVQATVERKLTVPVRIVTPPAWAEDDTWQRFVLKREDPLGWQKELVFRGPAKEIEKLSPEKVDAFVVLGEDDKKPIESWATHEVKVLLPPGIELVGGQKPSVELRLDPRPAGGTTPP